MYRTAPTNTDFTGEVCACLHDSRFYQNLGNRLVYFIRQFPHLIHGFDNVFHNERVVVFIHHHRTACGKETFDFFVLFFLGHLNDGFASLEYHFI